MMTNTYKPILGGLEKSVEKFSVSLREKGHNVKIVVPEYENMPPDEKDIVRLPALKNFNDTPFSINLPIPGILAELFHNYKPDMIHAHHPFFVGTMGLRLSYQYQIPLAFTHHILFENYVHYLPWQNEAIEQFVVQLAINFANLSDAVVAPSESVQAILLERGVQSPIHVIPTGLDAAAYEKGDRERVRQRWNIKEDQYVIGHVGRLAPEKNISFLVEAVCNFLKKSPQSHFVIVGLGPSEEEMKSFVHSRHLEERVIFTGPKTGKDLLDCYYGMDVFAFTSKSETQGLVLAEAMAAGVPVIALDGPGVRDIVIDHQNGRLIPQESLEAYETALQSCHDQRFSSDYHLPANARKTAQEFSMTHSTNKLIQLYESLQEIKKTNPSRRPGLWNLLKQRIRIEWELLKNLSQATATALTK